MHCQWAGMMPQTVGGTPAKTPGTDVPSSASAAMKPVVECHWTEHTSPDGFKYYHNSLTRESKVRHLFDFRLTVGKLFLN